MERKLGLTLTRVWFKRWVVEGEIVGSVSGCWNGGGWTFLVVERRGSWTSWRIGVEGIAFFVVGGFSCRVGNGFEVGVDEGFRMGVGLRSRRLGGGARVGSGVHGRNGDGDGED